MSTAQHIHLNHCPCPQRPAPARSPSHTGRCAELAICLRAKRLLGTSVFRGKTPWRAHGHRRAAPDTRVHGGGTATAGRAPLGGATPLPISRACVCHFPILAPEQTVASCKKLARQSWQQPHYRRSRRITCAGVCVSVLDEKKLLKVIRRSLPHCSKLGNSQKVHGMNSQKFSFGKPPGRGVVFLKTNSGCVWLTGCMWISRI